MSDKNSEDFRNGRRSRNVSPQLSENSDGSEDSEDGGMRVGDDFQAVTPEYNPDQKFESGPGAMLVWAPNPDLPDSKVDEYINIAKEKHGYNTEQALGMLFWHKHDVDRALQDLANFTPFPDEWTVEDKVLFEQAYGFHGKSFGRIRQMLPDKSISSLVKYFYSWKKTRTRTSLMDRHAKKRKLDGDSEAGSDAGSNHSEDDITLKEEEEKDVCFNCGLNTTQLHVTSLGNQCSSCYQYWRRTGSMRSAGPKRHESTQGRHNPIKHKRKPPKGMYLDQKDLEDMLSGDPGAPEAILKGLESEIVTLKRQVQNNKQLLGLQKHKVGNGVDDFRPPEPPYRINSKWTNEELLLAVQGVRKYGKDFQAIAEVIGNKLEAHVRSFFINFRRRYNLDEVMAEYEAEHGTQVIPDDEEEMQTDNATASSSSTVDTNTAPSGTTVDSAGDKKEEDDLKAKSAGETGALGPQTNGSSSTPLAPPPLLKQPVPPTSAANSRLLQPQKTILQQPPPLIRPSASAKTSVLAGAKDSKD